MEEAYTSWTTCDCEGKQNGTCLVRREIQPTRFLLEIYASRHEWTIYIWKKKSPKRAPEWIVKCQAQIWVAKDVSWSWLDFHLWNQVQKNGVFVSVIDGQEMRFRVWNISVDGDLMA